jgi:hypothetical protein
LANLIIRPANSIAETFIDLSTPDASVPPGHVHATAPGYLGTYRGNNEYWLPYPCFERIAGGKGAAQAPMAELHAKGLIMFERRGKSRSFSAKREISGLGRVRVIPSRAR